MGLLIDIPYEGATNDYLYARIRSRRAALKEGGWLVRAESGRPQQALLAEYRWLYRQAGTSLRKQLLPIFEYYELRLLVVALRYLEAGARSELRRQLQESLFHAKVIGIVESADQVVIALGQLQQEFAPEYPFCDRLVASYLRQGPGGLEQTIIGGHLQHAVHSSRPGAVKRFLRYLLDMRNLQALQKHLHWRVPVDPPLLPGGSLEMITLEKIWGDQDSAALGSLQQRLSQQKDLPVNVASEDYLLQGLTTKLHKEGREPLQVGVVIDYLWRCQLAAREQGLRLHRENPFAERPLAEVSG